MQKQKQKVIDNYIIGELIEIDNLGISVYKTKHSQSDSEFILKKAPVSIPVQEAIGTQRLNNLFLNPASFLYNQIQKIKEINCHRIIKCVQMIKTKRNLYLIYESYPQFTLAEYLRTQCPTLETRIFFAKTICETLQEIHRKCYVYLNLCPTSIFVDKGLNQIKFKGFQYAVKMGTLQQRKIQYAQLFKDNQYSAPELRERGLAFYESDIYSVGKILELLELNQKKIISENKIVAECFDSIYNDDPFSRPTINKIWSCLKILENQEKMGKDAMSNRIKLTVTKASDRKFLNGSNEKRSPLNSPTKLGVPKEKRLVEEDEKKLKKLLKIRNLVLFLHDLANFCLHQKNKELFYLLLKKGAIIKANLLRQCKKMIANPVDGITKQLKRVIQVLEEEQTSTLNLLSRVEEMMDVQLRIIDPKFKIELQNRKELDEAYLQLKIRQFLGKKIKEIKIFHTPTDVEERSRLVNLCGMSEKLVYGSFQTFFDEVVDENILDVHEQKYFEYLRKGSTREMLDRLDRIIKGKL